MTFNRFFARQSRARSRGQSLAEFALVVPVFMLILGGAIQAGVLFWGQNTINQVVRDAGRFAVTQIDCSPASKAEVQTTLSTLTSSMGVATLTGTPTVTMPTNGETIGPPPGVPDPVSDACPATSNADHVWVRIRVDAEVPVFFPFMPGGGAISSTALFRMEPVTP